MTDTNCYFDFSASGMVCQARMLGGSVASATGELAGIPVMVLVEKAVVKLW